MQRLSLHLILLAACTKAEPTTKAEPMPNAHACTKESECMASCRHGAVTRAWHTKAYPGGEACEDGCTSKGTEAPRCESGTCVAYRAGARDPVCTRIEVEPVAEYGPAHRCSADDQCITTCEHGAVNREWLSWQRVDDCGGGCTNPGHEPPKCEEGRCVAYRGGKPQPACTERPIDR